MRFFYCNQAFLEDFEENVVKRRKESLGKYCLWKIKKWAIKYKKEKVVQKYQESEVTCKICAQKVKIDKLKEHSGICRKIAELNKELKDMEMKLGEALSDTFMRSKELRTQLLVMKNDYQRLKKKNCSKSGHASISVQNSLHIKHLQKINSAASGDSIEDTSHITESIYYGSKTTREENEHEWEERAESKERRRSRKLILPEGTRIKINLTQQCQGNSLDDLNTSFGLKLDHGDNEHDNDMDYVSPGLPPAKGGDNQKSFVEKVLEKYPQKYGGSPSADRYNSPAGSHKTLKRMQSMTQKKRFAELVVKSKSSIVQFYSDRPRTESGSEADLDSERNATDDDKVKDRAGQDSQYSSEGSDALRLSNEMTSSEKSQCNSPDVSKTGKGNTVYKKSKFFMGNGLNFDKEDEEQKALEEEKKTEFEAEDEDEDEKRFIKLLEQKRSAKQRRTTVFFQRSEQMGEVIFGNLDKEMLEELAALKTRIENKRRANYLYEIIKSKGKIMLNQEPYKKDMEKIRDDTIKEITAMKNKTKDQDIIAFADNFIFALEKRIQVGKKVQEAQKSLDLLDGKYIDDTVDQKKFSLIRGHSSLTLTKKRLGFASTPVSLPVSTGNSEEPFSLFKSINLNSLKARSSHNTRKTFSEFNESALNRMNKDQPSQGSFDLNLHDKMRRFGDTQQKSLPELQEEPEDLPSVNRGDTSPFGVTNFDHSFNVEKEDKRLTERDDKLRINGPAPFSLDELIANSPREQTLKSENIDSKVTQISLVTDDSSPMTGTQNTIRSQKEINSKNLTITCGNEEIEEKEERKSPETPSFDAPPMIWRNSTAPARTLSSLKLQLNNKTAKNDILNFAKNLKRGESGESGDLECNSNFSKTISRSSSETPDGLNIIENRLSKVRAVPGATYEEEEQESEDKTPPSNLKSRRLLKRLQTQENQDISPSNFFREFSREESFEDEISPGRQLNRALHGTTSRRFIEDSLDEVENYKTKEESPHILGSPLMQRGYYSDSHVKKVHRTLSKHSLIGINDFELITMISKGAYGRVWLVRRKATNDIYAMKEINLGEKLCKNPKELESLRKENKIFGLAKEDFVVRAVFTFIHETYICFVMEYMLGGDFGDILYNYCALEEEVVRFYIAEIVLALEYLHSLGIVHRDLKPDNILLDKHGHAKLTDFGLSETGLTKKMAAGQYNETESPSMYQKKEQAINKLCRNKSDLDQNIALKLKGKVMARRSTIKGISGEIEVEKELKEEGHHQQKLKKPHRLIGTPDYMAPEIILGHSLTNYSIDWWSLGVLLFEFLCGSPPFNDDTPDKIYDNITKLKIPWEEIQIGYGENCMSPEAADLVKKLLVLDHTKRLGANSTDEIKQHPFFKGIDWEKLRTQQAPIIPEQKSEMDTSNFVRLGDELKKKDQENPFNFVPKDKTAVSNRQVAKEWLEAASENFSIFNYAALDSDNLRVAEEALKEKERELKEFAHHEIERAGRKGIYDDIFDMPN